MKLAEDVVRLRCGEAWWVGENMVMDNCTAGRRAGLRHRARRGPAPAQSQLLVTDVYVRQIRLCSREEEHKGSTQDTEVPEQTGSPCNEKVN